MLVGSGWRAEVGTLKHFCAAPKRRLGLSLCSQQPTNQRSLIDYCTYDVVLPLHLTMRHRPRVAGDAAAERHGNSLSEWQSLGHLLLLLEAIDLSQSTQHASAHQLHRSTTCLRGHLIRELANTNRYANEGEGKSYEEGT